MKRTLAVGTLLLSISLSGCATLFSSTNKGVMFTSEPTGAEVIINGQSFGKTPLSLNLKQKGDYAVTFRAPGYDDRAYRLNNHVGGGWIILDVLGGIIPVVIDAATGSWYSLDDSSVHGVLPASRIPSPSDSGVVSNPVQAPVQTQAAPAIVPASTNAAGVSHMAELPRLPGIPVTIGLKDGSVLPAKSIEPWSMGSYRVTLTSGEQKYVDGIRLSSVITEDGIDWTRKVLDDRKRVP